MAKARSSQAQATRRARAEIRAAALRSVGVDVPNVGPGTVERLRKQLTGDVLNQYNLTYKQLIENTGLTYHPPKPPKNKGRRAGGKARGTALRGRGELFVSDDAEALWERLRREPKRNKVLIRVAYRDWRGDRGYETKTLEANAMNPAFNGSPLPVPGQALSRYGSPSGNVQMTFGSQAVGGVSVSDLLRLADAYSSIFFALYDLWARIGRIS